LHVKKGKGRLFCKTRGNISLFISTKGKLFTTNTLISTDYPLVEKQNIIFFPYFSVRVAIKVL